MRLYPHPVPMTFFSNVYTAVKKRKGEKQFGGPKTNKTKQTKKNPKTDTLLLLWFSIFSDFKNASFREFWFMGWIIKRTVRSVKFNCGTKSDIQDTKQLAQPYQSKWEPRGSKLRMLTSAQQSRGGLGCRTTSLPPSMSCAFYVTASFGSHIWFHCFKVFHPLTSSLSTSSVTVLQKLDSKEGTSSPCPHET